MPQDIDVITRVLVLIGKKSVKCKQRFPFILEFAWQKIQSMRVINGSVNTQYRTGWLEFVFKCIQKLRNDDGLGFHSRIQLVYLERAIAFDKKHALKSCFKQFRGFFQMYEVKNRYAVLFSAAEFLDRIGAVMLNSNLYLKTIKKKSEVVSLYGSQFKGEIALQTGVNHKYLDLL